MPDWQEILSRDGPPAWRTAFRLLGNRADADECFQEACLAALKVSRREVVQDWRALFQRLATARAVDRLRARRRIKQATTSLADRRLRDAEPTLTQEIEKEELASEFRQALSLIPRRQAEAFCLHCIEDSSYAEIARHLGISIDAVGVLIHRARSRLRGLLATPGKNVAISDEANRAGAVRVIRPPPLQEDVP